MSTPVPMCGRPSVWRIYDGDSVRHGQAIRQSMHDRSSKSSWCMRGTEMGMTVAKTGDGTTGDTARSEKSECFNRLKIRHRVNGSLSLIHI